MPPLPPPLPPCEEYAYVCGECACVQHTTYWHLMNINVNSSVFSLQTYSRHLGEGSDHQQLKLFFLSHIESEILVRRSEEISSVSLMKVTPPSGRHRDYPFDWSQYLYCGGNVPVITLITPLLHIVSCCNDHSQRVLSAGECWGVTGPPAHLHWHTSKETAGCTVDYGTITCSWLHSFHCSVKLC